jgi:hypothetical protein
MICQWRRVTRAVETWKAWSLGGPMFGVDDAEHEKMQIQPNYWYIDKNWKWFGDFKKFLIFGF